MYLYIYGFKFFASICACGFMITLEFQFLLWLIDNDNKLLLRPTDHNGKDNNFDWDCVDDDVDVDLYVDVAVNVPVAARVGGARRQYFWQPKHKCSFRLRAQISRGAADFWGGNRQAIKLFITAYREVATVCTGMWQQMDANL